MSGFFKAKFEDHCAHCGRNIYEGDFVAYSDDEPDQLICQSCKEQENEDNA